MKLSLFGHRGAMCCSAIADATIGQSLSIDLVQTCATLRHKFKTWLHRKFFVHLLTSERFINKAYSMHKCSNTVQIRLTFHPVLQESQFYLELNFLSSVVVIM